ncbi:hypothetical protein B0T14DRAFT_508333 [Immersiella caudata]|uniref:Uncharacterized protein n=1 Tax=Immersiella caudata TaxID=314043 RepID=A0AA40CDD5_9PEZI|nr:hypothetical protein B0T14DRAFT_508333 [Immersiella caudata]
MAAYLLYGIPLYLGIVAHAHEAVLFNEDDDTIDTAATGLEPELVVRREEDDNPALAALLWRDIRAETASGMYRLRVTL